MLWLLSLFGFSNQGEEKSSCYTHAAVLIALCPYVGPSVCLFVCMPKLRSSLSDLIKEKKKERKLKIRSMNPTRLLELLICKASVCLVVPAGRQGWSCCILSSGCVSPLGSTGASHSLDRSPGKGRVREGRSEEPRAWRAVSLH